MIWETMIREDNADLYRNGKKVGWQDIKEDFELAGKNLSRKEAKARFRDILKDEIWLNNKYQVNVRYRTGIGAFDKSGECVNGFEESAGKVAWLSIKRRDKGPIHDWRDLQRIKNDVVGEECEAMEIYPAESRLMDTANQYHLFAFTNPKNRIPVGFTFRTVDNSDFFQGRGVVQRPLEEEININ